MSLLLPLLPLQNISGYSTHKKPTFKTLIQSPKSGREVTRFQQIYPLWEFELTFEILRDQTQNQIPFPPVRGFTDLQTLSAFWIELGPQFGLFAYEDPTDFTKVGQLIGIGDGVTSVFNIVRTFGTGAFYTIDEPIGILDIRIGHTLVVYINGSVLTQPGNWWIGESLRTIHFSAPPSPDWVITMDFDFFYLCRFIDDALEMEEFMTGRWTIKSLKFRSVLKGMLDVAIPNEDTSWLTP